VKRAYIQTVTWMMAGENGDHDKPSSGDALGCRLLEQSSNFRHSPRNFFVPKLGKLKLFFA
jgi:hypothetical protein